MKNNPIDIENQLSTRQRSILFAIIKEYCEASESLGSSELKKKYGFSFSPATIRSEMSALRKLGFLYQPFRNSSNLPTEKAFRIFINQLIYGLQVTSRKQKELKERLFELEKTQADMHREISRLLATQSGGVGFSLGSNKENVSGYKNLLTTGQNDEVVDILDFLENLEEYKPLLLESKNPELEDSNLTKAQKQNLQTFYGGDSKVLPLGKGYGMVASKVKIDGEETVVGLVTPLHILARKKNLELVQSLSQILDNEEEAKDGKQKLEN